MLKEICLADAYGAGFEYCDAKDCRDTKENNFFHFRKHPLHHDLTPGKYTDDGQMSIAVAQVIARHYNTLCFLRPLDFADEFVGVFKRDPRVGYSRGFQSLLEEIHDGRELMDRIKIRTDKNGAAMRSCPLGFVKEFKEAIELCEMQAAITHQGTGVEAAKLVTAAVWYLRNEEDTADRLIDWLNEKIKPSIRLTEWTGGIVKSPVDLGMITVAAAITCYLYSSSLSEGVKQAISLAGDTDTVAAIVGGLYGAQASYQMDEFGIYENITEHPLYMSLETEERRAGIEFLDRALDNPSMLR